MFRISLALCASAALCFPVSASAQATSGAPHGLAGELPIAAPASEARAVIVKPIDPAVPAGSLLVERDTLIRLMVMNEVTSKTARPGDRFVLRVDENVIVDGTTIIPVGAKAYGEVTDISANGAAGKSGKLGARLLYVEVAGDQIPLNGDSRQAGDSGTGATVMGVLALGPLGLFARGNNAKLKAGDIFNGAFESDHLFDLASRRLLPGPTPTAIPISRAAPQ